METARDKRTNLWAALGHHKGETHSCRSFTRKLSICVQSKTTIRGGNETNGSETQSFGHDTLGEEKR